MNKVNKKIVVYLTGAFSISLNKQHFINTFYKHILLFFLTGL